MTTYYPR